jgi:hypothetical protein
MLALADGINNAVNLHRSLIDITFQRTLSAAGNNAFRDTVITVYPGYLWRQLGLPQNISKWLGKTADALPNDGQATVKFPLISHPKTLM